MTDPSVAAVHVRVKGRVQGVGYRYFAEETAMSLELVGWVRNGPGGEVEAEAEGPRSELENWITLLRKGPPLARIDHVQVDWLPPSHHYQHFTIRS